MKTSSQTGSALWIILIAIALLAALSYIVVQGGRTSASNLTSDQARLAAQELISFGDTVATAVQTLKLRGCTDTQLMYYQPGGAYGSSFNNPSSPTDGSCNIFSPAGGAVNPAFPDLAWDAGMVASINRYTLAGNNTFPGTPSTEGELFIIVLDLKLEICQKINELLGIEPPNTTPKTMITDESAVFNGTYAGYNVTATDYSGKSAFCVYDSSTGNKDYRFIRIVLNR